ncbi:division/cell wall cluster transcriptional repressor MraZ [Mycoplasmopsis gallopavonis]|uniref:Transcriptional regulator MraZ n=1 Tax=Mycoplasmopsis gallopavonis TaxID=76629 RepID=A0A449AZA3_9BACT|nr:division/cell wall cluster transcriptional repressor MraZ [Mycoplasmopsis gallopavonis]RIV16661.1 transcriptional regulator MraZ [Mycoplasmopsis gallopavonis]VEU72840.1 cell division protein MraZ [Mycoplasmopsis gallopavonis]
MYGQHVRNLDDKSRVVLPSDYRDVLGSKFYITMGFDGNAELRSVENFQKYISMLEDKSYFDKKIRILTRLILGNAVEVSLDSHGRISLPKNLIEKLSITKAVVFVGAGSIIELWSKESFEEFEKQFSSEDIANIAQEISNK